MRKAKMPKPEELWCPLRGRKVPVEECSTACPAPEQRVVCAFEYSGKKLPLHRSELR